MSMMGVRLARLQPKVQKNVSEEFIREVKVLAKPTVLSYKGSKAT